MRLLTLHILSIFHKLCHHKHTNTGRSNALNIAARLGLSPSIIAAARQRLAVGVAAANAAIEELEAVQEEARQADMLLFAVNANVEETKVRVC